MKLSLKISCTSHVRLYYVLRNYYGRSKETTSSIKKSALRKGNVTVGSKVIVEWKVKEELQR